MEQLSPQDASFLYLETANAPMAGASFTIYDPSTAPGGRVTIEAVTAHVEHRLHLAPAFRRRVVGVPFDADHPWWVEDAAFDLEFHIRHLALPAPGDWRQLCTQVARLASRPLDLTKPLWEMYVIERLDGVEGYPPGCFAVLTRIHHAAIDGVSGAELTAAIHDLSPEIVEPAPPATPWRGEPVPSEADLLTRVAWKTAMQPWRVLDGLATAAARERASLRSAAPPLPAPPAPAPPSRFNAPISAHRVVDAHLVGLDELRAVRRLSPGCTVNDVVLAVVGGALRRYLDDVGELPRESLTAMCPISLRGDAERGAGGNRVGAMVVPLGTDIASGRSRLASVHARTRAAKELNEAVGARALTDLDRFLPASTAALAARLSSALALRGASPAPPYNTVVTNVPGPQVPLFMAGAQALDMFGVGIPHDGMGLMNTVGSYCGRVALGFTACREVVPDPARYTACLVDALTELQGLAAADGARASTAAR